MTAIPAEKALVERYKNRPFTIVGVNTDQEKNDYLEKCEQYGVTWDSIHDPYGNKNGPTKKWGVRGFPTSYLIDHKGVIRYRDLGKKELDQRVAELVAEAEE